jgi:hypothetical protein
MELHVMKASPRQSSHAPGFAAPATAPSAGMVQCDREGLVWLCEAVIRNGDIADWYLVRLSRLCGSDPVGDPVVLSPSEYRDFSERRGLHTVLL